MRRYLMLSVFFLGGGGAAAWLMSTAGAQTESTPEAADIAQGEDLYREYCAACHGADLEGQPPHDETGHTWHHPDGVLFDYTKLGGKAALALQGVEFESGMPGFGDQLSDAEIWNIIAYIQSTWPERQRAIQAERSADQRQQEGN